MIAEVPQSFLLSFRSVLRDFLKLSVYSSEKFFMGCYLFKMKNIYKENEEGCDDHPHF